MSLRRSRLACLCAAWASMASAAVCSSEDLLIWRLENGRVTTAGGAPTGPVPVGSLQKPFVARAWAASHPGARPPEFRCTGGSSCWFHPGHGRLGLTRATALSCNAYFRALAEATPQDTLAATLRAEGFSLKDPITPAAAIGLDDGLAVAITPDALLSAYIRLTREPWPEGDASRLELLAGLRAAALDGTAAALGRRGFWAKTGTSSALDGQPLATSGWAIAVDASGWAILGLLRHGTGREAARALGPTLGRLRPWSTPREIAPRPSATASANSRPPRAAPARVTVALFSLLHPRVVTARNVSGSPLGSSRGFVGPGGTLALGPGDRLDEGLWDLALADRRLERRLRAAIACGATSGELRVTATMDAREYAAGVMAAELPEGSEAMRVALGAAVLRFLAQGPRHATADVCDSTHCAFFVGRGPRVAWPAGERAVLLVRDVAPATSAPLAAQWPQILAASREPGPALWTSHCGGEPLSAWNVWGSGSRLPATCARHGPAATRPWSRRWSVQDVETAFGSGTVGVAVRERDGVWRLQIETREAVRELGYDDAHRLLAQVLGWGALPSPASRVVREGDAYRADGVGLGHRVGLCLGD